VQGKSYSSRQGIWSNESRVLIEHCGEMIRERRNVLKLSQEMLAEDLGVSVNTIGRLERGQIIPSAWMMCEIAKRIGIPIKDFCSISCDEGNRDDMSEIFTMTMEDETITVELRIQNMEDRSR